MIQSKFKGNRFVVRCCIAVALLALASCGGGGGGSSVPASVATGIVSGSAGDGPLVGTTVTITDANGTVVGTATTDANAQYNIAVPLTTPVPLTITFGLDGIDQVTGLAPTIRLQTVALTVPAGGVTANANPLSTLAVATAKALGGLTPANIAAAVSSVRTSLGFGVPATFDPIGGTINTNNVASTIKANEAAAELIRRAMAVTGQTQANTIVALAADLTDGVVDGKVKANVPGLVASATAAKFAAQVQTQIAAIGIEVINNSLIVTTNGTTPAPLKGGVSITVALDNAATLSNGGAAPAVTVANVPLETIFVQQIKIAVDAANTLSGGGNVALTAISGALQTLLTTNNSTTVNTLTKITNATNAATATSTAATNAAAGTNVAAANNAVTLALSFTLTANQVTVTDHNTNGTPLTAQTVVLSAPANGVVTANVPTAFNATNLSALITAANTTAKAPTIGFTSSLPVGSGTTTVTAELLDNPAGQSTANVGTHQSGERYLKVVFNVDWLSDGSTLTLTAAAGTATATFFTAVNTTATGVVVTLTNASANILSTGTTVNLPAGQTQINAAIANLFGQTGTLSTALNAVQVSGSYFYKLSFSGFPLANPTPVQFSSIEGTFNVQ